MSGAPDIDGLTYRGELGSGGFADVYLYEQHAPRREVAVKVIRTLNLPATLLTKFNAEANIMARLEHPHIVPIHASGVTADRRPFIVMTYYPQPNLGQRIRSGALSVTEVLRIGIQIGSAVETAHRSGLLHRDIKPANILVSRFGTPGLTDFGIASHLSEATPDNDDASISPPWASPEAIVGRPLTPASDVFSLAATLWTLLAGHSPFVVPDESRSPHVIAARALAGLVPELARIDVPAPLERLLRASMAVEPAHRPQTAYDLALTLRSIEQEMRLPPTGIVLPTDHHTMTIHPGYEHTQLHPAAGYGDFRPEAVPPAEHTQLHPAAVPARGAEAAAPPMEHTHYPSSPPPFDPDHPPRPSTVVSPDEQDESHDQRTRLKTEEAATPRSKPAPAGPATVGTGRSRRPPVTHYGGVLVEAPRPGVPQSVAPPRPQRASQRSSTRSRLKNTVSNPRGWRAVGLAFALVLGSGLATHLLISPRVSDAEANIAGYSSGTRYVLANSVAVMIPPGWRVAAESPDHQWADWVSDSAPGSTWIRIGTTLKSVFSPTGAGSACDSSLAAYQLRPADQGVTSVTVTQATTALSAPSGLEAAACSMAVTSIKDGNRRDLSRLYVFRSADLLNAYVRSEVLQSSVIPSADIQAFRLAVIAGMADAK